MQANLKKRILLFGKNGRVGSELSRLLHPDYDLQAFGRGTADFTKIDNLINIIESNKPDIIINAAAYTNVDKAEDEKDLARAINETAVAALAQTAKAHNIVLIHYSTDYVFDGLKDRAYTESDEPNPINYYGISKLNGERAIQNANGVYFIIRTSWIYSSQKQSFLTRVLEWARNKEIVEIVDGQVGSPTWDRMLAESTARILKYLEIDSYHHLNALSGVYHLAGSGSVSRYDWAKKILDLDPYKARWSMKEIKLVANDYFPAAADRPRNSGLDTSLIQRTFGLFLQNWDFYLALAIKAHQEALV